jgi:hypothetical protein
MRTPRGAVLILLIALTAAACGSTAPAAPTPVEPPPAPAIEFNSASWQGCATLAVDISAQQEGEFSGSMSWQGSGADSDKHCAFGGTFTGVMASDRSFTLRLNHNGNTLFCQRVSGESVFTGTLTADGLLAGQMTDRAACSSIEGAPTREADRTYRFSVRLLCGPPRCQVAATRLPSPG